MKRWRVRGKPSSTWSSGPREESPQTSQTTLPWISPVQALTPKTKSKRIKPISAFCFSMVEIEKKKMAPVSENSVLGSFLLTHWYFHRHNRWNTESLGTELSLFKCSGTKLGNKEIMSSSINTNQTLYMNFVVPLLRGWLGGLVGHLYSLFWCIENFC